MREAAKASHIFSTKNIGIFEILTFEIFSLTNKVVSFEQPGPAQEQSDKFVPVLQIYSRTSMARTPFEP